VNHRAIHAARQYLQQALDFLETGELERDPSAQAKALSLAGMAGLEAVNIITRARREVSSKRGSSTIQVEPNRGGAA
jgi:hypothetical protein